MAGPRFGPASTDLITENPGMRTLLSQASQAARTQATVLVQAESGTGKELLARWIHQQSNNAKGPFVAVNCAALPDSLLESELFGHEKGAFTGAVSFKPGKFELAQNGTILLDEIGEMAPLLQAKLLLKPCRYQAACRHDLKLQLHLYYAALPASRPEGRTQRTRGPGQPSYPSGVWRAHPRMGSRTRS